MNILVFKCVYEKGEAPADRVGSYNIYIYIIYIYMHIHVYICTRIYICSINNTPHTIYNISHKFYQKTHNTYIYIHMYFIYNILAHFIFSSYNTQINMYQHDKTCVASRKLGVAFDLSTFRCWFAPQICSATLEKRTDSP